MSGIQGVLRTQEWWGEAEDLGGAISGQPRHNNIITTIVPRSLQVKASLMWTFTTDAPGGGRRGSKGRGRQEDAKIKSEGTEEQGESFKMEGKVRKESGEGVISLWIEEKQIRSMVLKEVSDFHC